MKIISRIIKKILLSALLILTVFFVGLRIAGFKPYNIETQSMEPDYPVNTLIYVKEVSFDDLSEGDVITYVNQSGTAVTHRIVAIDTNDRSARTKGDANEFEDIMDVNEENIVGKVYFGIPLIGKLSGAVTRTAETLLRERSKTNEQITKA